MDTISKSWIYEEVEGKPIYYKGYQEKSTQNQATEKMGSSYLQSLIITELVFFLRSHLGKEFQILTNELGLKFGQKSRRSADIAIYTKDKLANQKPTNKYLEIPPDIVLEIDTKAELSELQDPFSYYHKKTDELLNFGVQKVIWIFTDSQKIMVSEKNKPWLTVNWTDEVEIIQNLTVNIQDLLDQI